MVSKIYHCGIWGSLWFFKLQRIIFLHASFLLTSDRGSDLHLEFGGILNRSLLISWIVMKLSSFALIKKIKIK